MGTQERLQNLVRDILAREGVNVGGGSVQQQPDQKKHITKIINEKKRTKEGELTKDVAFEIDPFKAGTALAVGSYLGGAFDRKPQDVYTPTYNIGVARLREQRGGFRYIDPATGQEKAFDDHLHP